MAVIWRMMEESSIQTMVESCSWPYSHSPDATWMREAVITDKAL